VRREEWKQTAEHTLKAFWRVLESSPIAVPLMTVGLDMFLSPQRQIVVVGKKGSKDLQEMLAAIHSQYIPYKVLLHVDPTDTKQQYLLSKHPELKVTACYLYTHSHCTLRT
jgi:uncharacterized protein YyaL (SSP411 family)